MTSFPACQFPRHPAILGETALQANAPPAPDRPLGTTDAGRTVRTQPRPASEHGEAIPTAPGSATFTGGSATGNYAILVTARHPLGPGPHRLADSAMRHLQTWCPLQPVLPRPPF